jgi:hypothetical protein
VIPPHSPGLAAGVGASPAGGSPATPAGDVALWLARLAAVAASSAVVALSVLAVATTGQRERSPGPAAVLAWCSACVVSAPAATELAELELHLHNPAKLRRLQAAHHRAPGRLVGVREQLLARSVRLIAGRPSNQSRAGAVTPARVHLVTGS